MLLDHDGDRALRVPHAYAPARGDAGKPGDAVFFDDRLATVLRQPANGEASVRTQYRQLLDILGEARARPGRRQDASLIAAAWLRLGALAEAIPAPTRAAMIREPGWRLRSPELVANLADQEPEVAAAALLRADLPGEDWAALIPRLPVRARAFVRQRHDLPLDAQQLLARLGVHDRGLPAPSPETSPAPAPAPSPPPPHPPAPPASPPPQQASAARPPHRPVLLHRIDPEERGRSEISALVDRIANFTPRRLDPATDNERSPQLPLLGIAERRETPVAVFGFATDVTGRIVWAESEVAPMVIGARLIGPRSSGAAEAEAGMERAFARRQPIIAAPATLAGAETIAGAWIVDAQPRFSEEGHFSGYLGRYRRVPARAASSAAAGPEAREADHIRQLLHELRTPVQTMQGYGEMIQQQLRGPVPHEYRALASAVSADAALILAGFDELDRFARLETGALTMAPGMADVAGLAREIIAQLQEAIAPRGSRITLAEAPGATELIVPIEHEDAEALLWRMLATLAAHCAAGETLTIEMLGAPVESERAGQPAARLVCRLPEALAEDSNLFAATARPADRVINAGMFGAGFALRLARSEARAAGGKLAVDAGALTLSLPLLTETAEALDA